MPRRAEIAVPYRAPSNAKSIQFTSRPSRRGRVEASLTPLEVALLEVLGSWEHAIELSPVDAWIRLAELLIDGPAWPEPLARASKTEPGIVRARLRELFEYIGRADLAKDVPEPDSRTTVAALRGLAAAVMLPAYDLTCRSRRAVSDLTQDADLRVRDMENDTSVTLQPGTNRL